MKTIKFIGYLFYRYYAKGSNSSPYFRTLLSMTMLGFFHLFQILIVLDKIDLLPIKSTDSHLKKRLVIICVMIPIALLMWRLFRKEDIPVLREKYDYDWDIVFRGNVWLLVYIISSFFLIVALAIWRSMTGK